MTRPAGVTASAVVAIIGSVFTLLIAGLMVSATFLAKEQIPGQAQMRGVLTVVAVLAVALAGLGIWTAVGLWRLRSWARTSILVFAGVMAAICLVSGLVLAFTPIPAPPELPRNAEATMDRVLVATYAVPFLIGVWWLVYFNKPTTRDAFAGLAAPGEVSQRPLSVSIIGWITLVGGVVTLVMAFSGMPAFVAGVILQGWSARLFYVVFGAAATYLGWGLLKLQEQARLVSLAWFGLGAAHTAYMALSPSARARMREFEASLQPERLPQPSGFDSTTLSTVMMLFSLAFIAAAAWFLVRNKAAFLRER